MIKALNLLQNSTNFRSEQSKTKKSEDNIESRILPNTPATRIKQGFQKTASAFLDYPVKGLKGDINSDFYEFLAMGIVPYLIGSAMFMGVFNLVTPYLPLRDAKVASGIGKKMGLGVVLYGLFKSISKNLVTHPVRMATGVDTEMPYEKVFYSLPKGTGKDAKIAVLHQQCKVYDSKEFFRNDLLKKEYFDNVAKKLGLGENLNDSVSETTPIIQNIVATTGTAKSLSSYCWAAVGVMLAMQNSWSNFFDTISQRKPFVAKEKSGISENIWGRVKNFSSNSYKITKSFCKSFGSSCKELWNGNPKKTGFSKHAGKYALAFSTLLTAGLTANAILRAKDMAKNNNLETIDKTKESMVI